MSPHYKPANNCTVLLHYHKTELFSFKLGNKLPKHYLSNHHKNIIINQEIFGSFQIYKHTPGPSLADNNLNDL